MKYLLLAGVLLGLISSTEAVTSRISKVLDIIATYLLKERSTLVPINYIKLKYEGWEEKAIDFYIKFYCSVFTSNETVVI